MSLPKTQHKLFDLVVPSTKAKLMVRQMLVREEKILLMGAQSKDDNEIYTCIKQVVNNCILQPKDFNIETVTIFDLEYLFLKLRSLSINSITKVAYIDQDDGKSYAFEIDLNEIEIKWPEKVHDSIKVDDSIAFTLKYPTARMYNDKEFIDYEGDPYFILALKCLDKVYDGDDVIDASSTSREEISDFIDELTPEVYDQVKDFFKNQPCMEHTLIYTNAEGTERNIVLTTLSDFFTLR